MDMAGAFRMSNLLNNIRDVIFTVLTVIILIIIIILAIGIGAYIGAWGFFALHWIGQFLPWPNPWA